MRIGKILIWLGRGWIGLAILFILLNYIAIWYFSGWAALQEIANPFNLINFAAVIVTLLPGIGLIRLGEYLKQRAVSQQNPS